MMQPLTVGVRFLLQFGSNVTVGMNVQDAKNVMHEWANGSTARKVGQCTIYGIAWMVDLSKVDAIHTIDAETLRFSKQKNDFEMEVARQQMQQATMQIGPGQSYRPGSSGMQN